MAGSGTPRRRSTSSLAAGSGSFCIRTWVSEWNKDPKPFMWTKTADQILEP